MHGEGVLVISNESQPATLLAEALSQAGGDDGGGLGVELAHLVAAVVVLGVGQVGVAAFGLAPGGVNRTGLEGPGPAVEPVHEVVLRRSEVGPSAQVQPYPTIELGVELEPTHHRLALRHHHEPGLAGRFQSQHRGRRPLVVRVRRRGGGVSSRVVEASVMGAGIWVLEGEVVVGIGGEMGFRGDEIGRVGEALCGVWVENGAVGFGILRVFFAGEDDR